MIDKVETYKTPWSSVGLITAKRTYCRPTSEVGEAKESWEEVIDRVMDATETQLHVGFTDAESAKLKRYMMELKGLVAGRFLWQLGTHTVDRLGLASLQNCAFSVIDEPVRPFTWAMDMLMLGVGVGINIQREHVYKLPKVKADFVPPTRQDDASADYIVPDTREGWVKLLEKTLKAAFDKRHVSTFTYSTQLIRGKGVKIKSFGGVASGPEELVLGIDAIAGVLKQRTGKQPRPIDCLDIIDIIGQVVVAGNVRRSAILALGDPDDFQFLRAKRWDLGNIPNWRANSNNSVVCDDFADLPEEFWKGYNGSGEPYGMINLKLARSCGRLGETQYKDKDVLGANPCITGDTLIAVADGRNAVAIKDLVGTTYPVYTTNSDKKVVIGNSSRTWKTRENAEIWALTLDDGSVLKATPDHMIMTRTGAYCALRDLTPGTSLMPFNSYISNKHYRQIASAASARVYVKNDKQASDVSRYNHKVVSSCFLGYENVYDMTVDITNNFGVITSKQDDRALTSSGVFVHNCAEQFLADKETCCLAEVALPLIESEAQFLDVAKLLYRVAKHSLHMKCHQKETESIVNKNMRMGLGISGYLQATEEQRGWCSNVYKALREYDIEYSAKMGWPVSIKLTTCKPSGCGVASTKLKTTIGNKSYEEMFNICGVTRDAMNSLPDGSWINVTKFGLKVFDKADLEVDVTKLYVNGNAATYSLEFEDGNEYSFTGNHKFLLANGTWKEASQLVPDDDILSW